MRWTGQIGQTMAILWPCKAASGAQIGKQHMMVVGGVWRVIVGLKALIFTNVFVALGDPVDAAFLNWTKIVATEFLDVLNL